MRKLRGKKVRLGGSAVSNQRGIVVPIVVIGLLAILAVAGLALDGSHALGNKTRMQNTADAAALAAAKVLDKLEDTVLATAAARSLFSINANGAGNHELNDAYDSGDITVTVQYSVTLNPFVPGPIVPSSKSWFVRVIATGFDTQTTLSRVLGFNEIPTPATAVAGPSGPLGTGVGAMLCDVAPIAVCSNDILDTDPNALRVLKPNPGTHGDIGPGNYKMLRFDDAGKATLRQNMAGSWDECLVVGQSVETEPGVASGPVSQGFNTRFNQYQGSANELTEENYPPDEYVSEQDIVDLNTRLKACEDPADPLAEHIYLDTTPGQGANYCNGYDGPVTWPDEEIFLADDIPYNYDDYINNPGPLTVSDGNWEPLPNRRVLKFPVVSCDGDQSGQSLLASASFACFFMVQSLDNGQADGAGNIFGQFIEECDANGTAGINPGGGPAGPLLYKIQLYKDPGSGDS